MHKIKECEQNEKLNLKTISDFYLTLDKGRDEKISILNKFTESMSEDEIDIRIQILQIFKKDLNEIEDFRRLGKILFFRLRK